MTVLGEVTQMKCCAPQSLTHTHTPSTYPNLTPNTLDTTDAVTRARRRPHSLAAVTNRWLCLQLPPFEFSVSRLITWLQSTVHTTSDYANTLPSNPGGS
jgi:hypothetical protein